MCGCLGHFAAVSSTDDGEGVGFELVDGQSFLLPLLPRTRRL